MRASRFPVALFLASLPTPSLAADTWSNPAPGLSLMERRTSNQAIDVMVMDLCTPGLSFRATAQSERGRTVSSFGQMVGAAAAINGDFFGSGYSTDGIAMHAGAQWSGQDHGYVTPVAIGRGRVELSHHANTTGAQPWMQEVVSGHPTILDDGAFQPSDDPLCTNRHPRTAVGVTADHKKMIWAVVDGRRTDRIGMTCAELAGLMAEFGAFDAVNMDGGGSSTMWVAGRGVVNNPSDGQQRVVGNHLAVIASGSGDAMACPDANPVGWLDTASCSTLGGWAFDPDEPGRALDVHIYIGGPAGDPAATGFSIPANIHRDDLCNAIGSCAHGFRMRPPRALMDGVSRPVHVYAIGGSNPQLSGSPKTLTCQPPELPLPAASASLRHVTSPDVMSRWRFDFRDVAVASDDVLSTYAIAAPWPDAPALINTAGAPEVWITDGTTRRHVSSPAVMNAWKLPWDGITTVDAAARDALLHAANLPEEPFLVRGSGPAVYVVDVRPALAGQWVSADAPVALPANASVTARIQLTNTGSTSWIPGEHFLAAIDTMGPSLCHPDWSGCERAGEVQATTAPGETGDFRVPLQAPTAGGTVRQCFTLGVGTHRGTDAVQGGPAEGAACITLEVTGTPGSSSGNGASASASSSSSGGASTGGSSSSASTASSSSGGSDVGGPGEPDESSAPVAGCSQAGGVPSGVVLATLLWLARLRWTARGRYMRRT